MNNRHALVISLLLVPLLAACGQTTPFAANTPVATEQPAAPEDVMPDEVADLTLAAQAVTKRYLGAVPADRFGAFGSEVGPGYRGYEVRCFGQPGAQARVTWSRSWKSKYGRVSGPSNRSVTASGQFTTSIGPSSGVSATVYYEILVVPATRGQIRACELYGLSGL